MQKDLTILLKYWYWPFAERRAEHVDCGYDLQRFGKGPRRTTLAVVSISNGSRHLNLSLPPLRPSSPFPLVRRRTRQSNLAYEVCGKYISLNGVWVAMAFLESLAHFSELAKGLFKLQRPTLDPRADLSLGSIPCNAAITCQGSLHKL